MLNPYRGFGVWSYSQFQTLGWEGFNYAGSNGRTSGSCSRAPRVRSNSAAMADEFFARAKRAWRAGKRSDAMFNLGVATHVLQDATVPSHTHPEVDLARIDVSTPCCGVIHGRDAFPAWANTAKENYRVGSGGLYDPPSSAHGVRIAASPGGWVYWMAALSYPYFPWSGAWSAIPRSSARCDVSDFPEECANASGRLLRRSQRVTAGFIAYFLGSVGE
jgi:hypothetical protein